MACVTRRRNRWVVDFRDQDGKRRWQSYETRDEADTALSKLVPALRQGTYRAPAELPTLEAVAREWRSTTPAVSSYKRARYSSVRAPARAGRSSLVAACAYKIRRYKPRSSATEGGTGRN